MSSIPTPSTPIYETCSVVPPVAPPNRRLWSSPTFSPNSDYYSGDDSGTLSPEDSFHKVVSGSFGLVPLRTQSQNQRIILDRLNGIAKAILASPDLTEHHFQLIDQDIDRLEETIAAPDSQTREPADVADHGLFVDDDDDMTEVENIEVDTSQRTPTPTTTAIQEANVLISRVVQVAEDMKQRFQDMKKLHRSAESTIHVLQNEIAEKDQKNRDLYDEISQYHTDFLYLKLSLKSLEVRVDSDMNPKIRSQYLADIDRWKMQWKHSTEQLRAKKSRKASSEATFEDDTSSMRSWSSTRRRLFMNGSSRSRNDSRTNSLTMTSPKSPHSPRAPRTPSRTSHAPRRVVSSPIPSEIREYEELESTPAPPSLVKEDELSLDEYDESTVDLPSDIEKERLAQRPNKAQVKRSAWEQLWDDLAELAGIHDPNA